MERSLSSRRVRIDRLELRHYRLLLETAKSGSLSLAGSTLSLSQPSATRLMNELEDAFGEVLTVRGTSGTRLTKHGQVVLALASDLLDRVEKHRALFEQQMRETRIWLRIGNSGSRFLSDAVLAFCQRYRDADISVVDGTPASLYSMLHNRDLDVIIGPLVGDMSGCVCLPLYDAAISFVVSIDHPLVAMPKLTWTDLTRFRWIIARDGSPFRNWLDDEVEQHGISIPAGSIKSASQTLNRSLLSRTNSILAFPEDVHQNQMERTAKKLVVEPVPSSHPFGAIVPDERATDPTINFFLSCVRSCIAQAERCSSNP